MNAYSQTMVKKQVMILSERYVVQILLDLLDADDKVKISDFLTLISGFQVLDALTDRMVSEGLVLKFPGRDVRLATFLELTPKGREVASKLKDAMRSLEK